MGRLDVLKGKFNKKMERREGSITGKNVLCGGGDIAIYVPTYCMLLPMSAPHEVLLQSAKPKRTFMKVFCFSFMYINKNESPHMRIEKDCCKECLKLELCARAVFV